MQQHCFAIFYYFKLLRNKILITIWYAIIVQLKAFYNADREEKNCFKYFQIQN